jgi:hypothetical protein
MGVHAVELTPATLAPVLPEGELVRNAHLAELPEGLQAMAGEVWELAVRSSESIASTASEFSSTDARRPSQPGTAGVRVKFAHSSDGVYKVRRAPA